MSSDGKDRERLLDIRLLHSNKSGVTGRSRCFVCVEYKIEEESFREGYFTESRETHERADRLFSNNLSCGNFATEVCVALGYVHGKESQTGGCAMCTKGRKGG